uniref:Uncharacterized protein n=1 Tax=viral metagenome TaxID=1070528 RepID=A0A6M3L4G8_9ZZZZ
MRQRFKQWLRDQACKRLKLWPHEMYCEAINNRVSVKRRGNQAYVVDIVVNVTNIGTESLRRSLCESVVFQLRKKAGWGV